MKNKRLTGFKASVMLFLLIFVMNCTIHMTKYMFSSAMADIVEEGVMTKSQTGEISALFWLVYAIFQVVGGFAADRFSPSKLILTGVIGGIACNFVIFINQSYPVIIAVWCINAALQFGMWPASFKIVSTQLNHEVSVAGVFWILFATSVGQMLSMLIASFVPHWHYNFLVSVLMLVASLVLWLVSYPQFSKRMVDCGVKMPERDTALIADDVSTLKLFKKSGLFVITVICFITFAIGNGIKIVAPVMLMESYDSLPASIATRMSVVLILFSVIGMFVSNIVRNRITENEMTGTMIMFIISAPFLGLSAMIGKIHYIPILLFLSFAIIFVQAASPIIYSFVSARFTKYGKVGTVSGFLNAIAAAGNVFASYAYPAMAEKMPWNTVTASWGVCAVIAVILALCITPCWTRFIKNKNI